MLICLFCLTVVATDDENIVECCQGFGVEVIMTSKSCRNGNDIILVFLILNFATSVNFVC